MRILEKRYCVKGTHLKGDSLFLCFVPYVADAIGSPLLTCTKGMQKYKDVDIKLLLVISTGEESVSKDILG